MVCGAREASEPGQEIAYRCGKLIAERGFIVASGYARGVDMASHYGALETGGSTLAVLPYGLARFKWHQGLGEYLDPGRFLAVSEVPPLYGFTSINAFRRNKVLAALSEAVIVVEPGESGGTWHSAEQARRMNKPLFYFEGMRPHIVGRMEKLGACRLELVDGIPDLEPVFEQCNYDDNDS